MKNRDDLTVLLREQLNDSLKDAERLRFTCRDLEQDIEQLQSVVRHQTEADLIYRSASIVVQLLLTGKPSDGAVAEQQTYVQRLDDIAERERMRDNLKSDAPLG